MALDSRIISGPEDDFDIPKDSFGKYVFDVLKQRQPNDILFVDSLTGDALTNGRLLEESVKLTRVYKDLDLRRGDIITLMTENSINYYVPVVAALYVGITVNALNPSYMPVELKNSAYLFKSKLIICSERVIPTILEVTRKMKYKGKIVLLGPQSENVADIKNLQDMIDAVRLSDVESFAPAKFDYASEVAFLLQSSGTTGFPKAVMITHSNVRVIIGCMRHPQFGNVTDKETTLLVLPMFHVFGVIISFGAITTGMKVVVMEKFKPDLFLQSIARHQVTKLFLVPPLLLFLTKSPSSENDNLESIKDIIVGAAPVGKELQEEAAKRFGGINIRQLYGLTETSGPCTFERLNLHKPGSVGAILPTTFAKVRDVETNKILGPLEVGELCFKGPLIMKGYAGNTGATLDFIDEDGFCHTGDLGYYDSDGYFYIVDRIKELIKYKGFQVSPVELEALILTHPNIKECGVVGIEDERAGQLPAAFVVKKDGVQITEKEIVDFVAARISTQKRLYGGVRFLEKIPVNPSGKILRRKLLELIHQYF